MTDICIFCDRPAESEEHLWSRRIAPEIDKFVLPYLAKNPRSWKGLERASAYRDDIDDVRNDGMLITATTIRCVCHKCNNEWMNNSDQLVFKKLVRLIRGQNASYDEADARYLASWLSMKMMIRDQYRNSVPALTKQQTINFRLTGLPPIGMKISLGRCDSFLWASAFQRQHVNAAGGVG